MLTTNGKKYEIYAIKEKKAYVEKLFVNYIINFNASTIACSWQFLSSEKVNFILRSMCYQGQFSHNFINLKAIIVSLEFVIVIITIIIFIFFII